MKVLVTGAAGLLGRAVVREASRRRHTVVAATRDVLDVTDGEACTWTMIAHRPDVVVHCAAYTAVDRAESEPDEATAVNRDGTRNVVDAADAVGARVVYPSTDYVFDGAARTPYRPHAPTAPLSVYGASKLAGEEEVRRSADAEHHLIVRTSWLYGDGGPNFVDTVRGLAARGRELRVVADQRGRPTWSATLAETVLDLLDRGASGTLHACDAGTASWFELAEAVTRLAGTPATLVPVSAEDYGAPAPRPSYSVLDLADTEAVLGRPLPDWTRSLERYLDEPNDRTDPRGSP